MTVDYLKKYISDKGFDMAALINDDFMSPVRILFNAKHYLSSSKLLLIAIDSIGFVEYGETVKNPFTEWLRTYARIETLGITVEELWEHRNALLHTSGLTSRKINAGDSRMLMAYVGPMPPEVHLDQTDTGYFNLYDLITLFAEACGRWCESYNREREKFDTFVERYDGIASDSRTLNIEY